MNQSARWIVAGAWALAVGPLLAQGAPAPGGTAAPTDTAAATPAALPFLDLPRFDTALAAALHSPEPQVVVTFYQQVSPNQLPQRLQKWLTAIEQSGGALEVAPPPGDLVPRNPVMLLSLVSGLWTSVKAWGEIKESHVLQAAAGHQATLQLGRGAEGDIVVSRLVFQRTGKAP